MNSIELGFTILPKMDLKQLKWIFVHGFEEGWMKAVPKTGCALCPSAAHAGALLRRVLHPSNKTNQGEEVFV